VSHAANTVRHQPFTKVIVGHNFIPFYIHKYKLAEQSPSFLKRAEHDGEAVHPSDVKAITIQDVDAETMDIVVQWLYTQGLAKVEPELEVKVKPVVEIEEDKLDVEGDKIEDAASEVTTLTPSITNGTNSRMTPPGGSAGLRFGSSIPGSELLLPSTQKTASNLDHADILGVYVFATSYDFPELQLDAMKCWQRLEVAIKKLPDKSVVIKACNDLPQNSPLLSMLAIQHAGRSPTSPSKIDLERSRERTDGLPQPFLQDVIHFKDIIHAAERKGESYRYSWCTFHGHGKDKERKAACQNARREELAEIEMRKRKGCWKELDEKNKRLKFHVKKFKQIRANHPKTTVGTLNLDEDYLFYELEK
jgi:hypothetical protein